MKAAVRDHGPTEVYVPKVGEPHLVEYVASSLAIREASLTTFGDSIVLVHGLFGHPENTWTHRTSHATNTHQARGECIPPPWKKSKVEPKELFRETFWPKDLLPTEFPSARVITWGYDIAIDSLFSETSKASIAQHADTLLTDLASLRITKVAKQKPLIFVAHSLGGIVVKDALSLSKVETTFFNEILPATIGVIFLGTPHRGSKAASLGKVAFEMSRALLKDPNIKILRALEKNSEILERISRSFGHVLASGQLKVHSFCEELKTKGMDIVDLSSSTIGYLHESRSSLHADHRNMTKFASAHDINFNRVSSVLRRWVDDIDYSELASNLSKSRLGITEVPDSVVYEEAYHQCLRALNVDRARIRLQSVEPAYPDTYRWLYSDELGFKSWLQGDNPSDIYWVSGKPGSGKSTVMKHAMTHKSTKLALRSYSEVPWLLTGYFFHDRGTKEQKTVDGFLREVLYQMLRQRKELFPLIHQIHKHKSEGDNEFSSAWWTVERLRQALMDIGAGTKLPLNCCLFVDALDEHEGNHRELILTLRELACMPRNPLFRLRLCVAGRPENIFRDAFHTFPGFAIHDHTIDDVHHYAKDRIRKEHLGILNDRGRRDAHELVDQIVQRADGVFLWVRLVVNELIEGLCEGDSFADLKTLLSEIPTELSELYARALRRIRRTSDRSMARHRLESYIMFQMILCARESIPIREFTNAAVFLGAADAATSKMEPGDHDQMCRRLNSRSAGLLESKWAGKRGHCVEFIHQTVKEFMTSVSGRNLIKEKVTKDDQQDGTLLLLRYTIKQLEYRTAWSIHNFKFYAQALEDTNEPAGKWLEPTTETLCRDPETLSLAAMSSDARGWLENVSIVHKHHAARLILFYIICDLPLSLDRYVRRHQDEIDSEAAVTLLEAALSHTSQRHVVPNYTCFQILLRAGIGVDMPQQSFDWLDQHLENRRQKHQANDRPILEVMKLWERFVTNRKTWANEVRNETISEECIWWQESKARGGSILRPICL